MHISAVLNFCSWSLSWHHSGFLGQGEVAGLQSPVQLPVY